MEEDIISKKIKSHYDLFNNYDFDTIKSYFAGKDNIHLEDEVLRRRIERIKNENDRKNISENTKD